MRFSQTLVVAATILSASDAINLVQPRGVARVIQGEIQRRAVTDPLARDRRRRSKRASGTVQAALSNEQTLYLMNVSVGTPAQNLQLSIDTGSSDLWVNTASSSYCSGRDKPCAADGTYSANSSSTYQYLNSEFNITYADQSGSAGDYATDVVSFGGITLQGQEFGIGYTSSSAQGIIGVGYATDEAILEFDGGRPYVNVPQHLTQSGDIQSTSYSLWLNDLAASTGSILFGGVNSGQYSGSLVTVPILQIEGTYSEMLVALTGVGYNGNAGSIASNQDISALLDSGTSLMYLPNSIANRIYSIMGTTYDASQGAALVSCSQQKNTSTIDFTFSSVTISVQLSELVVVGGYEGNIPLCIVGVVPSDGTQVVLGDTFLRSAYVVYDLHNNEISLAQTVFNSNSNNVQEITNSTVPGATSAAGAVSSGTAISSGGHINGGQVTVTSTSTSSKGMAATPPPAAYGAIIGAVGAGLMAVL